MIPITTFSVWQHLESKLVHKVLPVYKPEKVTCVREVVSMSFPIQKGSNEEQNGEMWMGSPEQFYQEFRHMKEMDH